MNCLWVLALKTVFSALTLLVGQQEGHPLQPIKKLTGPSDATATPSYLEASLKSKSISLFQYQLSQVLLEKRPLVCVTTARSPKQMT